MSPPNERGPVPVTTPETDPHNLAEQGSSTQTHNTREWQGTPADYLDGLSPIRLGHALVALAEIDPYNPLLTAVRLAVEQIDLREQRRQAIEHIDLHRSHPEWGPDELESDCAVADEMVRQFGKRWSHERGPVRRAEVQRHRIARRAS